MEIVHSQSLGRVMRLALMGAGAAFAWIAITLMVGAGVQHAHAEEGDNAGLLGAATSLVDQTASTATAVVQTAPEAVVSTVVEIAPVPALATQAAAPVVEAVEPVIEVAAPVVQAAAPVVEAAAPVVEAVPLAHTAAPVVDVVEATAPVVEAVVQAAAPVVQAAAPVVQAAAPVVQAAAPVVQAAAPVVEAVLAPHVAAPVVEAAAPVVEAATPIVDAVITPIPDIAADNVIAPIIEIVTDAPVIGDVAAGAGLDDALADLADTVTRPVAAVPPLVEEILTAIPPRAGIDRPGAPTRPIIRDVPALERAADTGVTAPPATLTTDAAPLARASVAVAAFRASAPAFRASAPAFGASALPATSLAAVTTVLAAVPAAPAEQPAGGIPGAMDGFCPASAPSSGPGGAGPGASALVALDPLDVHRAWVRHAGPEDEQGPPAPTSSTDVAPD